MRRVAAHPPWLLLAAILLLLAPGAGARAEDENGRGDGDGDGDEPKKPAPVCAEDASFERVATGFRFTEGPAADMRGGVYFSDIPNERIHRFDTATGKTTVFREQSGKANGLMVGPNGRLVACEGGARRVARIEADGKTTVAIASHWTTTGADGKKTRLRLNSPNDLALDADGGTWFTDPRYGKRQDDREIDIEAVYYVDARGVVHQRITDLMRPNGIALSLDGRTLYVADNGARRILAYPVTAPGRIGKGRLFVQMSRAPNRRGGPDGMCLDARGNLYCAGQGRIWIWSPGGVLIRSLAVPEPPTNCTFGGPGRRTLYVTARTSLYRVPMLVAGAPVLPRPADGKARAQGSAGVR